MHALIFNTCVNALINTSIQQDYYVVRHRVPSANDYMSHLKDVTSVKLANKQ